MLSVQLRTGGQSDEEHEDRTLRVAVANGGRDGWEPFFRIALVVGQQLFVL